MAFTVQPPLIYSSIRQKLELDAFVRRGAFLGQMMTMMILGVYLQLKVIGCSSLRGGGGELGTNKNLDLWLQLVCTKLKLKHAI